MTVDDKFKQLQARVDELVKALRVAKEGAGPLRRENEELRRELTDLRDRYNKLKLAQADRSNAMTEKLTTVLQRLDELEQMQG